MSVEAVGFANYIFWLFATDVIRGWFVNRMPEILEWPLGSYSLASGR